MGGEDSAGAGIVGGQRVLPSGTVTLLFSDIEGSTRLLARLGASYADALDAQRADLRTAWSANRGTELGTEGDSFYVVFATARDAVAAAAQAQRAIAARSWPQGERVRVRIGMHTGNPVVHDGAYVGMDVHRAARIAGAAHGGQVVLSASTAELAQTELPAGAGLLDLGSHQLKDIATPTRLYQLTGAGLETGFAPLKTLGASSALPVPATPLVGREGELAELVAVASARDVRLLTLTGPGGTGKTRLAIGLAGALTGAAPDGVYFVDLSGVTTGPAMWSSIAETMAVPPEGRQPPEVFAHIGQSMALLVLDNLEQVEGADLVVAELLARAPLTVVATSRRPLHVAGEHEHAVPTLDLPATDSLEAAERSGAVQLFAHAARRVRAGFALSADNVAEVVAICRRLDGLPLALELAAARTKMLGPRALLGRLDHALDIAATDSRVPGRQRTLRQTIAWSYDLLTPDQQLLFRQLGAFAGGADLDAIEAVAVIAEDGTVDLLAMAEELVDASLVTVGEGVDGEPRISLLETIRAFALGELASRAELESVRLRHALHFLGLAEDLSRRFYSGGYSDVRSRFDTEQANFREALRWLLDVPADVDDADAGERVRISLQLARAVSSFLGATGALGEAWRWLQRAAAAAQGTPSPDLARCLQQMARSQRGFGDLGRALDLATESVAMWRLVDPAGLPMALNTLAVLQSELGHPAEARSAFDEALRVVRGSDQPVYLHQITGSQATFEESEGAFEAALRLNAAALATATEIGDEVSVLIYEHNAACVLRSMGRIDDAAKVMRPLASRFVRTNEPPLLMVFAEDLASVLAQDEPDVAVRLLGAAEALRARLGTPRPAEQDGKLAAAVARTHELLGQSRWDDAHRTGWTSAVEDVVAAAAAGVGDA